MQIFAPHFRPAIEKEPIHPNLYTIPLLFPHCLPTYQSELHILRLLDPLYHPVLALLLPFSHFTLALLLPFPLEPNISLYLNPLFELLFPTILPEHVITGVVSVVDRGFNALARIHVREWGDGICKGDG